MFSSMFNEAVKTDEKGRIKSIYNFPVRRRFIKLGIYSVQTGKGIRYYSSEGKIQMTYQVLIDISIEEGHPLTFGRIHGLTNRKGTGLPWGLKEKFPGGEGMVYNTEESGTTVSVYTEEFTKAFRVYCRERALEKRLTKEQKKERAKFKVKQARITKRKENVAEIRLKSKAPLIPKFEECEYEALEIKLSRIGLNFQHHKEQLLEARFECRTDLIDSKLTNTETMSSIKESLDSLIQV